MTLTDSLKKELEESGFAGDIELGLGSRLANSTDNSVYQIVPDAIIAPFKGEDVGLLFKVLQQDKYHSIAITARGGGTGTNGQALNTGIIIDFRRHMNRVLEVNTAQGWADVEPGIVLDEFNKGIEYTGLFFAPTTSTANRCTIGGMVSTDASGKGSRIYGKTGDNIIGLEVVLANGKKLSSLDANYQNDTDLIAALARACDSGREALLDVVPKIARRFVGFDLERARPDQTRLEWWRLFIGAEGTLGPVTKIRVRLLKKPKCTQLVVLAFNNFTAALDTSEVLLRYNPLAIETLDNKVLSLAESAGLLDQLPASVRKGEEDSLAYNFVEFSGENTAEVEEAIGKTLQKAANLKDLKGTFVTADPEQIKSIWGIRKSSVGLLGGMEDGKRRPISFVEDCVVPPEVLPAFAQDFQDILNRHKLKFGMFGHVDVGCLHVRPALNIDTEEDRDLLENISDEVYALVKRYGGIFWGEHGKGVRGQYLQDFVGDKPYQAFKDIKKILDPLDRFNPGKLVSNEHPLYEIRHTPFRKQNKSGPIDNAYRCNGNGGCLDFEQKNPMCPSYKATLNLKYSPKGRSEILREWHQKSLNKEPIEEVENELFDSLDSCLSCKACAGSCPMQVDIPDMKSHFLQSYYRTRSRPLSDHIAISMERFSPYLQRFQSLLRLSNIRVVKKLFGGLLGLRDLPNFSPAIANSPDIRVTSIKAAIETHWQDKTVFLIQDPFTSLFDSSAFESVFKGLSIMGYHPVVLPLLPAGKAAHVKGARELFFKQANKIVGQLNEIHKKGVAMVGIDPAFVLMFRSEFQNADLDPQFEVLLIQEFLSRRMALGDQWPELSQQPGIPQAETQASAAQLFLHCTEQSLVPQAADLWRKVFEKLDVPINIVNTGCCGMAGMFGHEHRHADMSRKLFDMSWSDPIKHEKVIYASGFSCRCQIKRFTQVKSRHPMSLIVEANNQFSNQQNREDLL